MKFSDEEETEELSAKKVQPYTYASQRRQLDSNSFDERALKILACLHGTLGSTNTVLAAPLKFL